MFYLSTARSNNRRTRIWVSNTNEKKSLFRNERKSILVTLQSISKISHVTTKNLEIIHLFFRGFLSHFYSHLPHFYDVTWLIFEKLYKFTNF